MRKFLLAIAFLFLYSVGAKAQTTLQVTDAGSQTWNNGTWSIQLVVGGNIQYGGLFYVNGVVVPNQVQSGNLSNTGSATISLTPNNTITPVPTLWNYTVCPNANAICFTQGVNITTSNQAVTLTPPIPQVTAANSGVTKAYSDAEIVNALPGAQYYNIVSNTQRICNGPSPCTWSVAGGGVAASNLQVNSLSRSCGATPNCQTIVGDVLQDTNASYSNGSNIITVSAAMPAFTPANVVGKKGWVTGRCSSNSEYSCRYDCRYGALTYISANQVSLPLNCTNSSSVTAGANNFIFGTDDCAVVQSFFQSVFYPGGKNPLVPQELVLPSGAFLTSCAPFISSSVPAPVQWPQTIIGNGTVIYIPPTVSSVAQSGVGGVVALGDPYAQDALGDLGFNSFYSNFSFYCGGNDLHDVSGTLQNPSYYIIASAAAVFNSVYVNGCDWSVASATPVYGWACFGGQLHGSGTYAGGNFGMQARDLNGQICNAFGGNLGGSEWNGVVVTGRANFYGVYYNQAQCSTFTNKLCYGLYSNTASAVFNDYGGFDANIWLDNGKALMHGSNMDNFGSLYDFNLAGGTLVLDAAYVPENCNMTGGSLFDAAFNAAQGKMCPTGLTNTGGVIYGDASITGVAASAGNWALSAGWGTGPTVTSVSGNTKRTRYTVTVGTTPAANPTITHTFANPFLTGTVPVCSIRQDGGTQTAVANPFTVGTPTATSVVYTYTTTPGAGNTLVLEEDCSNL